MPSGGGVFSNGDAATQRGREVGRIHFPAAPLCRCWEEITWVGGGAAGASGVTSGVDFQRRRGDAAGTGDGADPFARRAAVSLLGRNHVGGWGRGWGQRSYPRRGFPTATRRHSGDGRWGGSICPPRRCVAVGKKSRGWWGRGWGQRSYQRRGFPAATRRRSGDGRWGGSIFPPCRCVAAGKSPCGWRRGWDNHRAMSRSMSSASMGMSAMRSTTPLSVMRTSFSRRTAMFSSGM